MPLRQEKRLAYCLIISVTYKFTLHRCIYYLQLDFYCQHFFSLPCRSATQNMDWQYRSTQLASEPSPEGLRVLTIPPSSHCMRISAVLSGSWFRSAVLSPSTACISRAARRSSASRSTCWGPGYGPPPNSDAALDPAPRRDISEESGKRLPVMQRFHRHQRPLVRSASSLNGCVLVLRRGLIAAPQARRHLEDAPLPQSVFISLEHMPFLV